MVKVRGTTIKMTRGDTAYIDISLSMNDGEPYVPTGEETIRFAMKKKYTDEEPLLLINVPTDTEELTLVIKPEDTKQLEFGTYVYDMELTDANGDVDTFINEATIELCKEVH